MTMLTAVAATRAAAAPSLVDLEYTTDGLSGGYGPVRSWAHLAALAGRVEAHDARWVVVRRRDDPGLRFGQYLRAGDAVIVEVGALDATTGRHIVWRLREHDESSAPFDAATFLDIARDWLTLGVVPGYAAAVVPLDGDDEPF